MHGTFASILCIYILCKSYDKKSMGNSRNHALKSPFDEGLEISTGEADKSKRSLDTFSNFLFIDF